MKPIDQTKFGSPDGNCFAAAIASVLEVKLEDIPDFDGLHQVIGINQWLKQFGLQFVWVPWATHTGHAKSFMLASGVSPRGLKHSVVCSNSGDIVHDPHPSRDGIAEPEMCGIFLSVAPESIIKEVNMCGEPRIGRGRPRGRIEVITGPMFASKTETMISRIHRATYAKKQVIVFKPDIDTRSDENTVVSHSDVMWPAITIPAHHPEHMLSVVGNAHVVGIEEAQFFHSSLVNVVEQLVNLGIVVIAAGLDRDKSGKPFGSMPLLLAIADKVDKLTAVCTTCGEDATCSQWLAQTTGQIQIGAADKYAARCRDHFTAM